MSSSSVREAAPVAGMRSKSSTESALSCLQFPPHNGEEGPATPPHVRRWRKSRLTEPGRRVVHPGLSDGQLEKRGQVFGCAPARASDHVEDVWAQPSELECRKAELAESVYASRRREPLGRSFARGHVVPRDATFGISTVSDEPDAAKQLLYAPSAQAAERPGEQRRRGYAWGSIDPATYRFGMGLGSQVALNGNSDQAERAIKMNAALDEAGTLSAAVAAKRALSEDALGRPRRLGASSSSSSSRVFGKATVRGDEEWDARRCIESSSSFDTDADLGTTLTPGFRNHNTALPCEDRPFGVPSVRSDVTKYARRSLADSQNYGDDPNASTLLAPPLVDGPTFAARRPKLELRDIFSKAAPHVSDPDFDRAFASVASRDGTASLRDLHFQILRQTPADPARPS